MSDEQILFLYKAFKCQGENGFAGDGFALTSASGILLKPDTAWLERGPRGSAASAARLGAARAAAEFRCRRVKNEFAPRGESWPPLASVLLIPSPAGRSLAEPTRAARAAPLWGGFYTMVELDQRRSRARRRVAKG